MVEINNLKHLPLKSHNLTINSPCPEPKPGQTAHAPNVQSIINRRLNSTLQLLSHLIQSGQLKKSSSIDNYYI